MGGESKTGSSGATLDDLKTLLTGSLARVRDVAGIFSREPFANLVTEVEAVIDHFDARLKALEAALLPAQPAAVAEKPAA